MVPSRRLLSSATFMMSSVMHLLQPSLARSFASVLISAGERIPTQTACNLLLSVFTLPSSVDQRDSARRTSFWPAAMGGVFLCLLAEAS